MIDQRGINEVLAPPLKAAQMLALREIGQDYPIKRVALQAILGLQKSQTLTALNGLRDKGLVEEVDGGWIKLGWSPTEPHTQPTAWDDWVAETLK